MRLLIGILYCGEHEYEQCIASIHSQSFNDYEYFVLKDLPNKEAHDTLYKTFMSRSGEFDLFIKIDADMVLVRDDFFDLVVKEMESHPEYDHIEILVDDYFSNSLIHGLNIFRSSVTWNQDQGDYFTDRSHESSHKKSYKDIEHPLVPAARHCPDPSDFQSYHYGLHKAVKLNNAPDNVLAKSILRKVRDMASAYRTNRDDPHRMLAMAGFFEAYRHQLDHSFIDYASEESAEMFQALLSVDRSVLRARVDKALVRYGFDLREKNQLKRLGYTENKSSRGYGIILSFICALKAIF